MADQLDRLTSALADRYRIVRELGAGGMSTVYLAEDLKHHRKVAIKVLRPELAAVLGADRFLKEIEVTANLQHPHILPLFDSGEADGFLYYVMPYVEGESLRDRLNREKQLPVEAAVTIAKEIADGLGSAHRHNVFHRDVKPENILLSEGHAEVADFGIAKAVHVAGGERLTQTGVAIGTAEYMSPEQAAGGEEVDGRSDVYSLGCVLYEMLAGQPPFRGTTAQNILQQHVGVDPSPVTNLRPTVTAEIAAVLERALEKTPADRFATASQLSEALTVAPSVYNAGGRRSGAAPRTLWYAVALLMIAAVLWILIDTVNERPTTSELPRLAVLPFDNQGTVEDEYVADGITEAITTRIASLDGLAVIGRQSVLAYKNSAKTPEEIAEELDVQYVMHGTIQRERPADPTSRVRIHAQLIQADDQVHLWGRPFDVELSDIFHVYSDIAEQVALELDIALLEPSREALGAVLTRNTEAHDAYLRGKAYLERRFVEQDLAHATVMFQRAVVLDPMFADAYAALGRARMDLFWHHGRTEQLPEAKRAIDSALALDPDLPDAHFAGALYYYYGLADYDRALVEAERVRDSRPNNADAHLLAGGIYRRRGEWDKGLASLEMAARLDPGSGFNAFNLAQTYHRMRRWEEAERYFERALALDPVPVEHYTQFAVFRLNQGRKKEAERILQELVDRVGPGPAVRFGSLYNYWPSRVLSDFLGGLLETHGRAEHDTTMWHYYNALGFIEALHGRTEVARVYWDSSRVLLEEVLRSTSDSSPYLYALSQANAALGRKDEAMRVFDAGSRLSRAVQVDDAMLAPESTWLQAELYAMLGEPDSAIALLEQVLSVPARRSVGLLHLDPIWDPLRSEERFRLLLAKYDRPKR